MLLSVQKVSKSFSADLILEQVSFRIEARSKTGIVGRNGCGKTTLLKLIYGQLEPDSGSIQLAKGARIGFLKQEDAVGSDRTVLEEAQVGCQDLIQIKTRLDELEKTIQHNPTDAELEEYSLLQEHFLENEGYSMDRDVRSVLHQMGFREDEFSKPTSVLSGGEKTRLALARLLLEEPDLLILDEPTNHLDLQATEWLEKWISAYHGAVLIVSHDRTFLENTVQRVVEIRNGTSKTYEANFKTYLELKAQDEARILEIAKKQEIEIAKLDEYVRRFMNSQRTAQARGRQKLMNKLIASKVEVAQSDKSMAAGFGKSKRSGDLVIECKNLHVGFENAEPLISSLNWTVNWGQRWGIIGENGAGKSTLIKVILGEYEPLNGERRVGSNVVCGFFHQDVADLDVDRTPLEYLVYEADMDTAPARDLLGRFLFSGDDVMRPIRSLSGGEKNKLVLARLTQMNPNLLVLDEPTNHLDMDSREALAKVLSEYKGTLILISHDRWFLEQLANLMLDIRSSGPRIYHGGYQDYRRSLDQPQTHLPQPQKSVVVEQTTINQRDLSKEITKQEKLILDLEGRVDEAEATLKRIEEELANVAPTADILELSVSHQRHQEELASCLSAWEEQSKKLEELQRLRGPAGHEPGVTFRPGS